MAMEEVVPPNCQTPCLRLRILLTNDERAVLRRHRKEIFHVAFPLDELQPVSTRTTLIEDLLKSETRDYYPYPNMQHLRASLANAINELSEILETELPGPSASAKKPA